MSCALCEQPVVVKGYCQHHYDLLRRHQADICTGCGILVHQGVILCSLCRWERRRKAA